MQLSEEQFERIKDCLPRQRGNVSMDSRSVISAIFFVAQTGCQWRRLPKHYGNWHSIYMRMSRWSRGGVIDRIFTRLQTERLMEVRIQAVSLDSTTAKVHPDGTGARKKTDRSALAFPGEEGGQAIHLAAANDRLAIAFSLSGAQAGDAPAGRKLLLATGPVTDGRMLLMDRAYEGDETRALAESLGYRVVVPPKKNRLKPWEHDKEACRRRNEVERLFRRLKAFRRVCTRYDKLDVIFTGFIILALIFEMLR